MNKISFVMLFFCLFFIPHGIWVLNNQTETMPSSEEGALAINPIIQVGNFMWILDFSVVLLTAFVVSKDIGETIRAKLKSTMAN